MTDRQSDGERADERTGEGTVERADKLTGARIDPAAARAPGYAESAVRIPGDQGPMIGVVCRPAAEVRALVLVVAGQPQTRVGSHRMFVELCRGLAAHGVASLRFDIGGWGDSPGEARAFERSDADIAAAAAYLRQAVTNPPPEAFGESSADASGLDKQPLWIWGLCDGASAAALALPTLGAAGVEPDGLCLVNPWVRSEASLSDAMVRTYYGRRLASGEFWRRLFTGKVSLSNLFEPVRRLVSAHSKPTATSGGDRADDLQGALLERLQSYRGRVLTVLSADDLTAGETESLMRRDRRWRKRLEREGQLIRIAGADHTFSDAHEWRELLSRVGTAIVEAGTAR